LGHNGHKDASDAFRHCYWSALITREIGENEALKFTTMHESSPLNAPIERNMDLHNNRIGIDIGKNGGSDMLIANRCVEALKMGRLTTI